MISGPASVYRSSPKITARDSSSRLKRLKGMVILSFLVRERQLTCNITCLVTLCLWLEIIVGMNQRVDKRNTTVSKLFSFFVGLEDTCPKKYPATKCVRVNHSILKETAHGRLKYWHFLIHNIHYMHRLILTQRVCIDGDRVAYSHKLITKKKSCADRSINT